jgi:hypothetical protein
MFEAAPHRTLDDLEVDVLACERMIARLRARQLEALRALDIRQVRHLDGSRTMADWTAARLDVSHHTARALVKATKILSDQPEVARSLADGEVSFDRAAATATLAATGATREEIAASFGFDLAGVARLASRRRRLTRKTEEQAFRDRYLAVQPSLDLSHVRGWFDLPGYEGRIVEKALQHRADEFPEPGDRCRAARGTRMADALVSIAQDSLDGSAPRVGSTDPLVTVFVDGALATATDGEAGAEIAAGPKVGPATLERILCSGRVQLVVTDGTRPVRVSRASRAIPPAIRRFVLHRDGGCVIDGCTSRYRLQPHHINPRSRNGNHDPENLATLCWYHHHVAVHGEGYVIDPHSAPQRRRLLRPSWSGSDPP